MFVCAALALASSSVPGLDAARPEVKAFIDRMAAEHRFSRQDLETLFAKTKTLQSTLDAMAKPAEKTLLWHEYRARFLTDKRIAEGVDFWQQHRELLDKVARDQGVAAEYLVAILGVETFYGRITGKSRVIDTLSTLAFDYPPRGPFFTAELEQFLLLAREEKERRTGKIRILSTINPFFGKC